MIEQPENKNYNILISNETPISLSGKTPNENIPNLQKNQLPTEKPQNIPENPLNTNEIESLKNNSTTPSIEQKLENENIGDGYYFDIESDELKKIKIIKV